MTNTKREIYFGFRYQSGLNCTAGMPNKITGNYSIAGSNRVFNKYSDLKLWLDSENLNCIFGNGGGKRISCTKRQLRKLNLGMSMIEFDDMLSNLEAL